MFIIVSPQSLAFDKGIFFNNDLKDLVMSYKQAINSLYHIKIFLHRLAQYSKFNTNTIYLFYFYFSKKII